MPGRSRGRAAAPRREAAYPGYPGYGDHPDDAGYDDAYDDGYDEYDDGPDPALRNGEPPRARDGHPPSGRVPVRDDGHEPLYARDHTPLGYDGGDPDDPPLLTHGRPGPARDPRDAYDPYDPYDPYDDYEGYDEYDDDLEDEYDDYDEDDEDDDADEEVYYDDEGYDDDAYGVGDGPLAVPPPGSGGRPLGPADVEELDPSMTDALARVDLGSMQVPVPFGADLSLEPAEGGRPQAVHLMLPEGRIAVSALAAPRSSGLWSELADEIEESLRSGGARVRGATGDWGRELHARTDNASSVFIGADGPRWMVYGVATAALETIDALDVELRRVMRGIIVVRGKLPYPPRTVLPLERAEDRAAAESAAQSKPRGASITVSVPAARTAGASGAVPAAAGRPDDERTTRTSAARNGRSRPGRPAAGRPGPATGRPTRSPDRPDTPAGRPGAPARRPAADRPERPAAAQQERPGAGRPDRPAAAQQERPAAGRLERPGRGPVAPVRGQAPSEQTIAVRVERDPEATAAHPVRRPETRGVRAEQADRAGPGSGRPPRAGGRPAAGPQGGAVENTGAAPARRGAGDAAAAPLGRGAGDTGAAAARRGAGDAGAAPVRRAAGDTGASTPRLGVERTASSRLEGTGSAARGISRPVGAGAEEPPRRGPVRPRADEYEPEAPVTQMLPTVDAPGAGHTDAHPIVPRGTGRASRASERAAERSLPLRRDGDEPVRERRGESIRGHRGEPAGERWAEPDRDLLDEPGPERDDGLTGGPRWAADPGGPRDEWAEASPEASPEPSPEPDDDLPDEPPARRDPAVMSLPALPGVDPVAPDAGPDRSDRSDRSGERDLPVLAGDPLGDEPTPRHGTRGAAATGDLWGDAGHPEPAWRDEPVPEPEPVSRMAIEDIPLSDVELLDATLDSVPVAPPEPVAPERRLPRRRPGATRRAAGTSPDQERAGRRRRGAEDDVLSDWMSAEIAARPAGRHAQPGRDAAAADDSAPRRARGGHRAAPEPVGEDLFRSRNGAATNGAATNGATTNGAATNGAATNGATTNGATTNGAGTEEDRTSGRPRHNGRSRNGNDAVDPMTLFSAARDPGRHRRG